MLGYSLGQWKIRECRSRFSVFAFGEIDDLSVSPCRFERRKNPSLVTQMINCTIEALAILKNSRHSLLDTICQPIHLLLKGCGFGNPRKALGTHYSAIEVAGDFAI